MRAPIADDVMEVAASIERDIPSRITGANRVFIRSVIARAIMAERERWNAAVIYFDRYCQDEADDVENCVCGEQQHEDAKAFAAIRSRKEVSP